MSNSGFTAERFSASQTAPDFVHRPRLAYWAPGAARSPAVDRAAAELGVDLLVRDIALLDDPQTIAPADGHWVVLDAGQNVGAHDAAMARATGDLASLVVEASSETIDTVWARFFDCDNVAIVVTPDETDCAAAMAHALARRHASLASPTMDDQRDRQLARLQEEVHRISTLLSRLSIDGGNYGGNRASPAFRPIVEPSPFIEEQLHAPIRGYGVQPDLASYGGGAGVSAALVRRTIRQRRMRDELFPAELFADPAWDMMLDLFAARLERNRVSVSSLCIAAAVPATTALRWIKTMTDTGLFIRDADPHDKRRIHVALSDDCATRLQRYFLRMAEA